ncbi:MAG: ribonuclease E/G [Lachnospiraceae bacterium]|nr:ribonuclease E/G [Lachnospiraceae bacterium]
MIRPNQSTYSAVEEMRPSDSRILLFAENGSVTVFFLENGRIAEVWQEKEQSVRTGDIYLGRVGHYAANIDAYYVEILKGVSCFLPADETVLGKKRSKLHEGEEVLVQIKKEAYKTKLASASTKLEIAGKYSVVSNAAPAVYYSRKIKREEKERLKKLVEESGILEDMPFQMLLRTAAAECQEDALVLKEIVEHGNRLRQIITESSHTYPLCRMYEAASVLELLFQEERIQENTRIITQDQALYERINELCRQQGYDPAKQSMLYSDTDLPMTVLYGLKSHLREITEEKVWLPSGASIYIAQTEALNVIDVNTGKYVSKSSREETFLKINLEAAREIAFQIRARNLSGIILIDFINMKDENNATILLADLRQRLQQLSPRGVVVDITKLGLVEITREKRRPDIYRIKEELNKIILR